MIVCSLTSTTQFSFNDEMTFVPVSGSCALLICHCGLRIFIRQQLHNFQGGGVQTPPPFGVLKLKNVHYFLYCVVNFCKKKEEEEEKKERHRPLLVCCIFEFFGRFICAFFLRACVCVCVRA